MLDVRAAEGFRAAYFSDERLAAAEVGASASVCEFDPLTRAVSTADAALARDADVTIRTNEVLHRVC